jgi:nucleotide-binding universal stress UspA family protein
MSTQTILIPVEFPDPDPVPSTFVETFTACKVVLHGLDEVDDEASDEERHRREIEANRVLYSLASQFMREGEAADVELLTGEDLSDAPTSVAERRDADAVMIPKPLTTLGRILVPIRDEKFAQPITDFLTDLNLDALHHTTLFHVAETESDVEAGERLLSDVREQLVEAGLPDLRIDSEVVVSDDPTFEIREAAGDSDLVVMGETQDPSFASVFGDAYQRVADETDHPVIVVREHE